jgi:hypothetical protein
MQKEICTYKEKLNGFKNLGKICKYMHIQTETNYLMIRIDF